MGIHSEYPKMSIPPRKRFYDSSNSKENQEPLNRNSPPLFPSSSEPEPHIESDPEPSRKRTTPDSDPSSSSSSELKIPTPTARITATQSDDLFDALSSLGDPKQIFSDVQPKPLSMILPDHEFAIPDDPYSDAAVEEWSVLLHQFANDTNGRVSFTISYDYGSPDDEDYFDYSPSSESENIDGSFNHLQNLDPVPGRSRRTSASVGESSGTSSSLTPSELNFVYNLDEPLLTSPSSKSVGAGIENLGNTCFMSAVLQCFTHTVPLLQGLRSCNHNSPCNADGVFCAICAFRQHFNASLAPERSPVRPKIFIDNLNFFSPSFVKYSQEDAHEFMQCALDKLKGCFPSGTDNLVENIFEGRLLSKLRCCNCGRTSDTYEPFIDLSLEIKDIFTLEYALESFTKVEKIDEKFRCDGCNEYVSMEKQLKLDQTPLVVAFHLKRFKRERNGVNKIVSPVYFPTQINLHPYTSTKDTDNPHLNYQLYAIIQHSGHSPNSGHYRCFIRSAPIKWYKMDDSLVTNVSEDVVLEKEAYILFYVREDTPWFSSIVEGEQCNDPNPSLDVISKIDFGPFGLEDKENVRLPPPPPPPGFEVKQAVGPPPGFEEMHVAGPPPGFEGKENLGPSGCGEKKDAGGPSCKGHVDDGSKEANDESVSDMDDDRSSAAQTNAPSS